MWERSASLIPVVLLLTLTSTTYSLVIGDWENSMDGWILWNTNTYPATTAYSETGVTLGLNSLQVTSEVSYGQNLAIRLQDNDLIDDFLVNRSFSIDVTWVNSEWSSSTTDNWAVIDLVINATGVGWSNQGKPDQDTGNPGYFGGWDTTFPDTHTRTVTWDYGHLLDGDPSNGEITATPTSGYVEIIITTTYANGFLPPDGYGGIYYFDNAQLIGGIYKTAQKPNPANNATDVKIDPTLTWKPGAYAVTHDVYLGTDSDSVNDANAADHPNVTFANVDVNNFEPGSLDFNTIYYWRVDEVNDAHIDELWKGEVWSFTTGNFLVVDDFEDYNDYKPNRIFDAWSDYFINNTGMTVGHLDPPFAERSIVNNGYQSMYMRYDNDGTVNEGTDYEQSGILFYSETQRQWDDPQDWTKEGAESLTLWFRGIPASVGSFTVGPPITMTAGGADIWDTSDQFHYAYKQFSGEGNIIAKVVSVTNTNVWAKAGVMIRETLAADAKHVMVVVTPGSGVSLQYRPTPGGGSEEITVADITAPQRVRLTRSGNTFTGEYSANGNDWQMIGSITTPMPTDVYIGLCLTSHNVDEMCTAEFSDVVINGTVTGDWQSQDIGIESNIAEPMYIALQDSSGNSAIIKHPDPAASAIGSWTEWNTPLTDITGVNLQAVKSMAIGVGDPSSPDTQPDGAGTLYIDDIRLNLPAQPEPDATGTDLSTR